MPHELSEAGAFDAAKAAGNVEPEGYTPRDADVLLWGSPSLLGRVIRWFLREPGEPARINHVGLVCELTPKRAQYLRVVREYTEADGLAGACVVIEAIGRGVVVTPLAEYRRKAQKPGHWLVMARLLGASGGQTRIVAEALGDVGRRYSVARLLAWGLDRLVGTRITGTLGPDELVCSTLVAAAYMAMGYGPIGGQENPHQVSPDDWWDEIKQSNCWELFGHIGPGE